MHHKSSAAQWSQKTRQPFYFGWMRYLHLKLLSNSTNEIVRKAVAPITQILHVAETELKQTDRHVTSLNETVKQHQITRVKMKIICRKISRRNNIKIDTLAEKE